MGDEIAARLDALEARNELLDLISGYAQGFDHHDATLLRSIWTEDAVLVLGPWGRFEGVEEVMGAAAAFWSASPHMHHWMANPLLEVDLEAGTATASTSLDCYCTYLETGTFHIGGRYRDRFVREEGRWAIAERIFDLAFYTPLPDWKPEQGSEAESTETATA
jgi:hypothetical protein